MAMEIHTIGIKLTGIPNSKNNIGFAEFFMARHQKGG